MLKIVTYFLGLFVFASTAVFAASPPLNAKAPDFSLYDQHDRLITLQELLGRPIVLIASDREGRKQNGPWGKAIGDTFGGRIHILGVADVRSVPSFLRGMIKDKMKKDPVSVLLDWDGAVFESYGLMKNVSNIVLIDKKGFVRFLYSGSAEPPAVEKLFQEIEKSFE